MAKQSKEERRASKREYMRKWRAANPEYNRKYDRAYRATDRGYAMDRASTSRTNAIRRGATIDPDFTIAILADILLNTTTCAVCNDHVDLHDAIIDHRKAIVFGGAHTRDNVQIICADCNKQKSSAEKSLRNKLKYGATKADFELTA
jgi:5-methylcytosine-specific restriction endonuclease McrA